MALPQFRIRPRIALYSHDAQGLGHIRRNLALAGALQDLEPAPDVLLLTGAPEAAALRRPPNTDVVGLPSITKNASGGYAARHLALDADELRGLRTAVLTATLTTFNPDLLIVDKHPRGFRNELEPALQQLARRGHTRIVLGLRDVLDAPERSRIDWEEDQASEALSAYYSQVWLYGDTTVHDVTADLALPAEVAELVVPTGYLAHGRVRADGPKRTPEHPVRRPYVLCVLGGGSDGAAVAEAFVSAPMPAGHTGVLVSGPQMPAQTRQAIRQLAAQRDDMQVHDFLDDLERWFTHASAVVSMGGYNTVCEVLATDSPLLIVPRVAPRAEQLVRATKLAAIGAVDVLHPAELAADRLGAWMADAVQRERGAAARVDLDGLSRICGLAHQLMSAPLLPRQQQHPTTRVSEAEYVA